MAERGVRAAIGTDTGETRAHLRDELEARVSGLLLAILLASLATPVWAEASDAERGAALLAPFKRELQQALQAGLAQGPVEAISACRVEAPEIARGLSRDGVRMGRASHRLRNPANAPSPWVAGALDAWLADPSDRAPRSFELPDGRRGYAEPIVLQPLCVTCHGEQLAPDVAARIHALYPEDRAVGFRPGDLRGAFWVEFPAEPGPPAPPDARP